MGCLEPMMVSFLVTFIYVVFIYCNLVPQMQHLRFSRDPDPLREIDPHAHVASLAEIVGIAVSFHVTFFLFLLSFVRAILTPAGSIPKTGQWADAKLLNDRLTKAEADKVRKLMKPPPHRRQHHHHPPRDEEQREDELESEPVKHFLRRLLVVERKSDGTFRYCKDDKLYKPDRCHHCKECQECVLRMDHHCPWISNCVGFGNYKFFMLVLFYAILCTGFLLGAMLPRVVRVFDPITSQRNFVQYDLPIGVAYAACALVFIAVGVFFAFHLWLTLNAMTTIEYKEKRNHEDPDIRRKFQVAHVKFDKGHYHNFTDVFGPAYMWLLPIEADVQPDGTYSDIFCSTWDDVEVGR